MSVKNTRQKGRAFVKKIVEILRSELDNGSYEVVGSGSGTDKGDIRIPSIDLVIEAKDQKQPQVASWIKQSDREGLGYSKTALMWRHPDSPSYNPDVRVDISLDLFIELAKRYQQPLIKEPDKETKYWIGRVIADMKQLEKRIT
jgi:hypothetical protein